MRSKKDLDSYFVVMARDSDHRGYPKCINCGNGADDVHEILPRSFFGPLKEDELFDVKNRCCLCRECHSKLHNDRGRKKLLVILRDRHDYQYDGRAKCLLEEQMED